MVVICVGVAAAAYSVAVACVQAAAHEVWRRRGVQALGELRCATHQNGADTTAIRFEHCKSTPSRSPSLTFETEPKHNRKPTT